MISGFGDMIGMALSLWHLFINSNSAIVLFPRRVQIIYSQLFQTCGRVRPPPRQQFFLGRFYVIGFFQKKTYLSGKLLFIRMGLPTLFAGNLLIVHSICSLCVVWFRVSNIEFLGGQECIQLFQGILCQILSFFFPQSQS